MEDIKLLNICKRLKKGDDDEDLTIDDNDINHYNGYIIKNFLLERFDGGVTNEILDTLINANKNSHTIMHIIKSPYYSTKEKGNTSQGRKSCCNWFPDGNGKRKCGSPVGIWWCVECTYRTPLSPTYLCSECANVNLELSKPKNIVFNTTIKEKCHSLNPSPSSYFNIYKATKR